MADQHPRFEFRVWAETLEHVRNKLQRLATAPRIETSEETYLISATTDKCNTKIRRGRLSIKALLATEQRLELWKPVLEAEFPLDRSLIAERVFPGLEVEPPDLRRSRYWLDEFVNEVIRAQSQIAMVTILKKRTRFRLDECLAESTLVTIGKVTSETVAVEAIEPNPVLRLIRQLGIASMPNTNYVRLLKQVIGDGKKTAFS
jgi:hypothetical protein